MWKDPIIEELHQIRRDYAKQFDYDLNRVVEHLQSIEKQHPEKMVSFPPKRLSNKKME